MKKNIILTLITLFTLIISLSTASAQTSIQVNMQVNGETETAPVKQGDTLRVTWTSEGSTACSIASSYGDFQWNGKEVVSTELPASGDIQVQVVNWSSTAVLFSVYCWNTKTGPIASDNVQLIDSRVGQSQGESPVITKLSPTQGPVGTLVTISGKNFKNANGISFVGSMRPVSGADMSTVSPIDGETYYENVPQKKGTISFVVPSAFTAVGEDEKTHITTVVPGIYYVVVQTESGKSGVSYFKVTAPGEIGKFKPIQTTYLINQDLQFRDLGPEVTKLQRILAKEKTIYPEGRVTGYYGALTVKAVERFQCKYQKICSADNGVYGKVDMSTRLKIEEVFVKTKVKAL
jgi:hypothetical protein